MAIEVSDITKIRQLLFGEPFAELETRLGNLEKAVISQIGELNQRNKQDYEQLKSAIELLNQTLTELADSSKKALEDSFKQLEDRFRNYVAEHDKTHQDLNATLQNTIENLEKQKLYLLDHQQTKIAEIQQQLLDQTAGLQQSKVERQSLASLLTNLAIQLGQNEQDNAVGPPEKEAPNKD
jgi:ATP-dependent Clp protease ATP-binding subunit ClpA